MAGVIVECERPAAEFRDTLRPGGRVPVLFTPKDLNIIVTSGNMPGSAVWTSHQTKPVCGATLTKVGN